MPLKRLLLKTAVALIYVVSHVYDYVSYPVYWLYYHPWRVRRYKRAVHAREERRDEKSVVYASTRTKGCDILVEGGVKTTLDLLDYMTTLYGSQNCIGTRRVLRREDEKRPDGKVFTKYAMGEYEFRTYDDLTKEADSFAAGLRDMGLEPKTRIAILAETRCEWLISVYGAYINNLTVVTLYTNLGEEGVWHGLDETEVPLVICSHETLPKLKRVLGRLPKIQHVIVMPCNAGTQTDLTGLPSGVRASLFGDVRSSGQGPPVRSVPPPQTSDVAIVMYTSGSSGTPKGALISHGNMIAAIHGLAGIAKMTPSDRYIAFLPLAHVLELLAELTCLVFGVKIGYSSPSTLTNKSTKVKPGTKGDANQFRPTMMCSVPLILERIYKSVVDTMRRQGWAVEELFHYFVAYKMKWQDRGFDTPLLNKTLFRKVRYFVGGRMNLMLSGGAPLSTETHSLTRTCICVPLIQGYGLTETTACATVTDQYDRTTGRAGAPLYGVKIKLVDWEEGNYSVNDSPYPRGEIHVGGGNVVLGYFKNPAKTAEDFYEEDGVRWFRTGDIGQVEADGVVKIIDRKKDLVKLQGGEYVSYGKIESVLKTCPIVENVCAYADPSKDYLMAVVIPDAVHLAERTTLPTADAIIDPEVISKITREIREFGLKNGLERFEVPSKILLIDDEWTPDNGRVTAAFKIRRKVVFEAYKDKIVALYT